MLFDGDRFLPGGLVARLLPGWEAAGLSPAEAAAFATGVLYSPAVFALLPPAHSCRCCVTVPAKDLPALREAVAMAIVYLTRGFRRSAAYRRALDAYATPAPDDEQPIPRRHRTREPDPAADWHGAWAACAERGMHLGHCPGAQAGTATPAIPPHTWFVDSPLARRFLRALARHVAQKGWRLEVRRPRPEEYLALPRPAAVKVVALHGAGGGKEAWATLEVFARQWRR